MDRNPENELILMIGSQGHSLDKGVQAEADHDPQGEQAGSTMRFVDVAVLDPVRELLQYDLE